MTNALEISNLQAWYGESHILHDVNLTVKPGEVVTFAGPQWRGAAPPLCAPSWG